MVDLLLYIGLDTIGAFFRAHRLMLADGMQWHVPDTKANRAASGPRAALKARERIQRSGW
jgi:hypothetical protein